MAEHLIMLYKVALTADLIAKVNDCNNNWDEVIAKHEFGNMNENEEMFVDICFRHYLLLS